MQQILVIERNDSGIQAVFQMRLVVYLRWTYISKPDTNVIEYVTIASTGNAVDFGIYHRRDNTLNGASSTVRGLCWWSRTTVNVIDLLLLQHLEMHKILVI